MTTEGVSTALKQQARALGFNLVGIAPAQPSRFLDAYERWIEAGMHGEMGYMARADRVARRRDLNVILPGVRSLIVVGYDYSAALPETDLSDPARGRIARYAWGMDYHDIMLPKLDALAEWLSSFVTHHSKTYVDTGAILERGHAYAAGMGFVGKNTMFIHPRRGSYFFIGEILTTLEFDQYDTPAFRPTMCGSCTRCLSACPTDAFPQPHVLDARRCISYLTIEHKGWIDRALRPLMGNWVYGCDVCQEVCPFQRFSNPHPKSLSLMERNLQQSRDAINGVPTAIVSHQAAPLLLDLLALDDATFGARFAGSAIARIKRERIVRNACVAAGNWGSVDALPALLPLVRDVSPLVRGHAAWAVGRIGGEVAHAALAAALTNEPDEQVREEIMLIFRG
ncbi:MAG: tRNA epoxyqueuosine(34) reductase QueG [Chloroflexota bacterium]|nr:tRNA epoxyqueuosine(34) reductase QueG [Chloroflexota bacterium]